MKIRIIKHVGGGGGRTILGKYITIAQCHDLQDAINMYTEALSREVVDCDHRWKEVDGKWICTKCN